MPLREGARGNSGSLVRDVSPHEAEFLLQRGMVEGIANKNGLKHLRLTVPASQALKALRRSICSGGRTIAEDNSTVARVALRCGGVSYAFVRTYAWSPAEREGAGLGRGGKRCRRT